MAELKTNPSDFIAEFPQFTKYLQASGVDTKISEPKVIDKGNGIKWVKAKIGNSGELTLVYQHNGEELINQVYQGRLPVAKKAILQYSKEYDAKENEWQRKDGWPVPFP